VLNHYAMLEKIAFIIPAIGLIVTIAIYLDRKWSNKRKLAVKIRYGFNPAQTGERKEYIVVTVTNPSNVRSTLKSVSIGSGKDLIYFPVETIFGYEKLPLALEPGESHDLLYDYQIIRKSLKEHGQNKIDALCNDALGNKYEAKTFKIRKGD